MSEQKPPYWVEIEKNPNSKSPGQISFNLADVYCVDVVRNPGDEDPTVVIVRTKDMQVILDGVGAAQFMDVWEEYQDAQPEVKYQYRGERSEKSNILRPTLMSPAP